MKTAKQQKALKAMNDFSDWMQNKIKTIHYANNEQMSKAYEKVYNNNLTK